MRMHAAAAVIFNAALEFCLNEKLEVNRKNRFPQKSYFPVGKDSHRYLKQKNLELGTDFALYVEIIVPSHEIISKSVDTFLIFHIKKNTGINFYRKTFVCKRFEKVQNLGQSL